MSIAAKLLHLDGTKTEIRTAIEEKGVVVDALTAFRDYADKIREITVGEADTDLDADVAPETTEGFYFWGRAILGTPNIAIDLTKIASSLPECISNSFTYGAYILDGELFTWGSNNYGQTGQGTAAGETNKPTKVGSFTDWHKVSCGERHALAIRKTWNVDKYDYTLWSWGSAANGRLGNGTTTPNVTTPTQIGTDTDWEQVSAGNTHSLAIKAGGLYSCGQNFQGRTGQGTQTGDTTTFTQIATDPGSWTDISAGYSHSLAIRAGEMYATGFGSWGKTGLGNTTTVDVFTRTAEGDSDWAKIAAGGDHSIAIKTGGTLHGTGRNSYDEWGHTGTSATTFTQVGTDTNWQQVALANTLTAPASSYSLAIKGGGIYGTGQNINCQVNSQDPDANREGWAKIHDGSGFTNLATGGAASIVVRT